MSITSGSEDGMNGAASAPPPPRHASLSPEASFSDHGPALVVFSGGTAFNSVAGRCRQCLGKRGRGAACGLGSLV